jgi:signal transduction histidine kinase/ActR/RegA family two-component response regulator
MTASANTREHSLAWHLSILIAVLAVPLLVLTIVPSANFVRAERFRLEAAASQAREDALSRVDRDVSAKLALLRALATSRALDAGDFDQFDLQARELTGADGFFIVLRDRAGRLLVDTLQPRGMALPDLPEADTATDVVATRRPAVSNLVREPLTGRFVTVVAIPVMRGGAVTYVLEAGLSTGYFADLLRQSGSTLPYYAVLADRAGTIIASTEQNEEFVGRELPGFREITLSEGTWSGPNPLGVPVYRVHRRSLLSGWIVSIAVPQAYVSATPRGPILLVIALGAAVAVVALACGIFLSRRLTSVFQALNTFASGVGEGNAVAAPRSSLREANEIGLALEQASRKLNDNALKLRHANDLLETRVAERTQELGAAKKSAELARERAEAANEAKSQFLASMSHELRTPLNAISGYAQLLQLSDDALTRERRTRYTQSIMDASDTLKSVVDDLLDLARVEAGRIDLKCEPVDCFEVMTEACRTLEPMAKAREVTFTVDTTPNLPFVMADRKRLIQVLLNVGSNAVKYNVEGGWVQLTAYPVHDHTVRFAVRDGGRGIPPERQHEIFLPFNRLGAELGPVEGTGVGLAISRKLAQAMHGDIGFDSVPGAGSTFWIDIPIAEEPPLAHRLPASPPAAAIAARRSTVLYIEDKVTNVELVRSILESRTGLHLVEAQTVRDGIELARAVRPALVITDIHLSDGKGFDVLKRLRDDPETARIPVIALTADAMSANMQDMERVGFDHIVTKPFKVPELLDAVHQSLMAA